MKDILNKAVAAKRQVVEGSIELWNARLELLQSIGDIRSIVDHLKTPVEPIADNGYCGGCNCGAESLPGEIAPPPLRTKAK